MDVVVSWLNPIAQLIGLNDGMQLVLWILIVIGVLLLFTAVARLIKVLVLICIIMFGAQQLGLIDFSWIQSNWLSMIGGI